jgi:hypothetical protein
VAVSVFGLPGHCCRSLMLPPYAPESRPDDSSSENLPEASPALLASALHRHRWIIHLQPFVASLRVRPSIRPLPASICRAPEFCPSCFCELPCPTITAGSQVPSSPRNVWLGTGARRHCAPGSTPQQRVEFYALAPVFQGWCLRWPGRPDDAYEAVPDTKVESMHSSGFERQLIAGHWLWTC